MGSEASHLMHNASLPQVGEVVNEALAGPNLMNHPLWASQLTSEASHLMHNASLPQVGEVVDQASTHPDGQSRPRWVSRLTSEDNHLMHRVSQKHADEAMDQSKRTSFNGVRFFAGSDALVSFFKSSLSSDRVALVIDAPTIHNRTLRVLATMHVPG